MEHFRKFVQVDVQSKPKSLIPSIVSCLAAVWSGTTCECRLVNITAHTNKLPTKHWSPTRGCKTPLSTSPKICTKRPPQPTDRRNITVLGPQSTSTPQRSLLQKQERDCSFLVSPWHMLKMTFSDLQHVRDDGFFSGMLHPEKGDA